MPDLSAYKVSEVVSVEECGTGKGGKPLYKCAMNVGSGDPIPVVTAATVRVGFRVAVAPVGSMVTTPEGEELEIKKTSVGGVMSEGMICDSVMLGWSGGAAGMAAKMPESLALGSAPPDSKPRFKQEEAAIPESEVKGLFEKKLTKEEKKKLAEERKAKRKAAKEAKQAAEAS